MEEIIIYTLTDPKTNEVRYVGKTTIKNYKNRYKSHINPNIKSDKNKHKVNWIKSIIENGNKPIMEVLDVIIGDWEWVEKYWIEQFKAWGFNLVNKSIGGDKPPIKTHTTDITKEKIRKSRSDIKKLKVNNAKNGDLIGIFNGVNLFIKEYIGYDRYKNPKEFKTYSSKISSIANKKKWRKSYKNMLFEYVE